MARVPRTKRLDKVIGTIDRSPAFGRPDEEVRCIVGWRSGRWVAEWRNYKYARTNKARHPGEQDRYDWVAKSGRVQIRNGEADRFAEIAKQAGEYLRDLDRPGRAKGKARSMLRGTGLV